MPDINVAADNELNRDIAAGYWQTVDDFINDPNPYILEGQPGSDRWREAFIAGFDACNRMIDGKYYGVSNPLMPFRSTVISIY